MARFVANVKVVASMITNQVSGAAIRREFTAAVEASRKNPMDQKPVVNQPQPAAWMPDSAGYYRPENVTEETDAVEASRKNLMDQKPVVNEPAAWMPDSEGYYRPENVTEETDVGEVSRAKTEELK